MSPTWKHATSGSPLNYPYPLSVPEMVAELSAGIPKPEEDCVCAENRTHFFLRSPAKAGLGSAEVELDPDPLVEEDEDSFCEQLLLSTLMGGGCC